MRVDTNPLVEGKLYAFWYDEDNGNIYEVAMEKLYDREWLWNFFNEHKQDLGYYHVSDISALKNLTALEYLDLSRNNISDISVLRDLKNLRRVTVTDNPIRDYSPVSHVENVSK